MDIGREQGKADSWRAERSMFSVQSREKFMSVIIEPIKFQENTVEQVVFQVLFVYITLA